MNIYNFRESPIFYGRRKGRKLSKTCQLAIKDGKKYLIQKEDLNQIFNTNSYIILEIGYGDGENLVNSAKINPEFFYIGSDPFLNTTAKCLYKLIKYNIKNVMIWPDDVRKIISLFPKNSISEIKILFPDPWPKKKHKSRRLVQDDFLELLYSIMKPKGTITIGTDHDVLKLWILKKFQRCGKFEWIVKNSKDWQTRPSDCFETKYEIKSLKEKREPSWFIFKK